MYTATPCHAIKGHRVYEVCVPPSPPRGPNGTEWRGGCSCAAQQRDVLAASVNTRCSCISNYSDRKNPAPCASKRTAEQSLPAPWAVPQARGHGHQSLSIRGSPFGLPQGARRPCALLNPTGWPGILDPACQGARSALSSFDHFPVSRQTRGGWGWVVTCTSGVGGQGQGRRVSLCWPAATPRRWLQLRRWAQPCCQTGGRGGGCGPRTGEQALRRRRQGPRTRAHRLGQNPEGLRLGERPLLRLRLRPRRGLS